MRCQQVRQKLTEYRGDSRAFSPEIREHLEKCDKCAEFARGEQILCQNLTAAGIDDNQDSLSWIELRHSVEREALANTPRKAEERNIMSLVVDKVRRKPRLGITIAIAAAVLAFVMLFPFNFSETIGYEVAIAGVDQGLAIDNAKVEMLFEKLGLEDASFGVDGCEKTCNIIVSDLKTEGDAQKVKLAFEKIGNCVVKDIKAIEGDIKHSIFAEAKIELSGAKVNVNLDSEQLNSIVVECLDDLVQINAGAFNIWVSDGDENASFKIGFGDDVIEFNEADLQEIVEFAENIALDFDENNMTLEGLAEFLESIDLPDLSKFDDILSHLESTEWKQVEDYLENLSNIHVYADGQEFTLDIQDEDNIYMTVTDDDGNVHRINLMDEDAEEQLKALGFEFEFDKDGGIHHIHNDADDDDSADTYEAEKSGPAVPEGFELKQNYPNPFNPTTEIKFNLPESQQAELVVYNMQGRRVATLLDSYLSAGEHSVEWNSKDDDGNTVASGMYLYKLTAGDISISKKMTLVK